MPAISPKKPYRVGRSRTGLGLFATKAIKKGTKIIRYFGPLLDSKKKKEDAIENKYLFELNNRWTIDGSVRENIARYINHACKPNAESDVRPRKRKVFIRAIKNIEPGEEINYDYGTDYFKSYLKPIGCKCDACEKKRRKKRAEARAEKLRLKVKAERKAKRKAEKSAKSRAKKKLKEKLARAKAHGSSRPNSIGKQNGKQRNGKRLNAERLNNGASNGQRLLGKHSNRKSRSSLSPNNPEAVEPQPPPASQNPDQLTDVHGSLRRRARSARLTMPLADREGLLPPAESACFATGSAYLCPVVFEPRRRG